MTATETKLVGFTEEQIAALEAAGWIKGTDCGYRNHTGFVWGGDGPGITTSLHRAKNGGLRKDIIRDRLCDYSTGITMQQALSYGK